jgi:hypothetical protein
MYKIIFALAVILMLAGCSSEKLSGACFLKERVTYTIELDRGRSDYSADPWVLVYDTTVLNVDSYQVHFQDMPREDAELWVDGTIKYRVSSITLESTPIGNGIIAPYYAKKVDLWHSRVVCE